MFLRGVLKVGDGGLEESANKQVAGGDGGEMPIFVLRQATRTQQNPTCTSVFSQRVLKSSHMLPNGTASNLLENRRDI